MKFTSKLMKLETLILNKATKSMKINRVHVLSLRNTTFKQSDMCGSICNIPEGRNLVI